MHHEEGPRLFLGNTLVCNGAATASEYHVAQKNLAANDKNPGTADIPFKTIHAAITGARLKPGDTLYVHEGVYREAVELASANAHQGRPGAHIRIIAWPNEIVEIKGSDEVAGWREYDGKCRPGGPHRGGGCTSKTIGRITRSRSFATESR